MNSVPIDSCRSSICLLAIPGGRQMIPHRSFSKDCGGVKAAPHKVRWSNTAWLCLHSSLSNTVLSVSDIVVLCISVPGESEGFKAFCAAERLDQFFFQGFVFFKNLFLGSFTGFWFLAFVSLCINMLSPWKKVLDALLYCALSTALTHSST